tara:strand:- start:2179 stop:2967 length:789 start_codon:yes stop_codon:yes gene_type:complete
MPHISFSELKAWDQCSYYHKLTYLDKIRLFSGNEYTAFGKAIHEVYEHSANCLKEDRETGDLVQRFKQAFLDELLTLKEKGQELKKSLITDLKVQGEVLASLSLNALKEYFGEFEIIKAEESIFEDIIEYGDNEYKFKGYIDLVVRTSDGKVHIIDWKTCSWGWDARKRSDPMITYQLTFYKKYYAQKYNIDPKNIETHFALVKRTAKKDFIELFRVTSGPKKTKNALNLLKKALYNIDSKLFVKNKLSCSRCEFFNTQYCK